jgi:hypothetical protein
MITPERKLKILEGWFETNMGWLPYAMTRLSSYSTEEHNWINSMRSGSNHIIPISKWKSDLLIEIKSELRDKQINNILNEREN